MRIRGVRGGVRVRVRECVKCEAEVYRCVQKIKKKWMTKDGLMVEERTGEKEKSVSLCSEEGTFGDYLQCVKGK
jgi:hypothetical protein